MSTLRLHLPGPWVEGASLRLPEGAARHVQVWRLQPGDRLRLFDGQGREHEGRVEQMTRQGVTVSLGQAVEPLPEPRRRITLAVGMPANERMDTLVEKATELGVWSLQPLLCERSVLRLAGDRAQRKCAHWQAVAVAASEQSGRAMVPHVAPVQTLAAFLASLGHAPGGGLRLLLSLQPEAPALASVPLEPLEPFERPQPLESPGSPRPLGSLAPSRPSATPEAGPAPWLLLSGPEGGLSTAEEAAAQGGGFRAVSLGPRVLRADTAPLAALSWLLLQG